MVVSDEHRYVFVELPHTGSTAIHRELCELYGGRPILTKHARYHQFLEVATPEQRDHFAFAGIRHPMDEAVSVYFRYKTNHQERYTDPAKWRVNGGSVSEYSLRAYRWIESHDASFADYLRRFHRKPYDNWSSLSHRRFDAVIRFERLAEDFADVLRQIGIEPVRPLPVVNKTSRKRAEYWTYYTPDVRDHARRVFGPFMEEWGYEFPADWPDRSVPLGSRIAYRAMRAARRAYWRAWGHRLFG